MLDFQNIRVWRARFCALTVVQKKKNEKWAQTAVSFVPYVHRWNYCAGELLNSNAAAGNSSHTAFKKFTLEENLKPDQIYNANDFEYWKGCPNPSHIKNVLHSCVVQMHLEIIKWNIQWLAKGGGAKQMGLLFTNIVRKERRRIKTFLKTGYIKNLF
jgi:hypothetical protein